MAAPAVASESHARVVRRRGVCSQPGSSARVIEVSAIDAVRRYAEFPPAAAEVSLGLVIPTRNRARLAIEAVRSVLNEQGCRFEVFVSDNSTDETEVRRLADFCAQEADPRLTYLRPEAALGMPAHWDWA